MMRLLAVAALVSSAVHLKLLIVDDYAELSVVGPAFVLNVMAGVVIAGLLLFWHHWIPLLLVVGFGASTLGAFVISTTVGLFDVHEQWSGWAVWTAAVAEAVMIVVGLTVAWQEGHLSRHALGRHAS